MNQDDYNLIKELLEKYGIENPSDKQIEMAIEILNEAISENIDKINSQNDNTIDYSGDGTYIIK
jgi:uncharacterized protein YqhQ